MIVQKLVEGNIRYNKNIQKLRNIRKLGNMSWWPIKGQLWGVVIDIVLWHEIKAECFYGESGMMDSRHQWRSSKLPNSPLNSLIQWKWNKNKNHHLTMIWVKNFPQGNNWFHIEQENERNFQIILLRYPFSQYSLFPTSFCIAQQSYIFIK
jgi:hypothetical protein